MNNQEIEIYRKNAKAIEYITGVAAGFPVVIAVGAGRPGTETEFQIMPDNEFKSGVGDFWEWHVDNNEQWFATPLEAAADFVRKRQDWLNKKSQNSEF